MQKLTSTEMKSVHGGVMDYLGCEEFGNRTICCIDCGGRLYCGSVSWYLERDVNPDYCS